MGEESISHNSIHDFDIIAEFLKNIIRMTNKNKFSKIPMDISLFLLISFISLSSVCLSLSSHRSEITTATAQYWMATELRSGWCHDFIITFRRFRS